MTSRRLRSLRLYVAKWNSMRLRSGLRGVARASGLNELPHARVVVQPEVLHHNDAALLAPPVVAEKTHDTIPNVADEEVGVHYAPHLAVVVPRVPPLEHQASGPLHEAIHIAGCD